MFNTERIYVRKDKKDQSESLNVSFSSNNSFYENLPIEIKRDIISLIKAGYDRKIIIKLYILTNPSNISEAIHFLTKENGIYQHIFFDSQNKEDSCEICGEKKIIHNNEMNKTINISFYKMDSSERGEKINKINIKNEEEKNYICKICEEEIINKKEINNNKCEQCETYFCQECLYLHIKELIKNGKYALFCPECRNIYTKNKIEQIFMLSKDKEVKNLKKLLEKNKTKDII